VSIAKNSIVFANFGLIISETVTTKETIVTFMTVTIDGVWIGNLTY
jgi:hypothetical protein